MEAAGMDLEALFKTGHTKGIKIKIKPLNRQIPLLLRAALSQTKTALSDPQTWGQAAQNRALWTSLKAKSKRTHPKI